MGQALEMNEGAEGLRSIKVQEMTTSLSIIASLSEIIASIALVISLIFVGVQLRMNTRATKSASAIAASTATSEWYRALGGNAENSALFRAFVANPEGLTPDQRYQSVVNLYAAILIFQNNFYLAKEGTLDPEMKDTITQSISVIKDYPGWKYFWEERRSMFLSKFQDYVDALMTTDSKFSSTVYDPAP
jgi:hypothetical protein